MGKSIKKEVFEMIDKDDLQIDIFEYNEYNEDLEKKDFEVLLKELKKINETAEGEWTDKVTNTKTALENEIANRLGLVSSDMFQRWQDDVMDKIADEIEDVAAKLRNHRHDVTKKFSSKAEF